MHEHILKKGNKNPMSLKIQGNHKAAVTLKSEKELLGLKKQNWQVLKCFQLKMQKVLEHRRSILFLNKYS